MSFNSSLFNGSIPNNQDGSGSLHDSRNMSIQRPMYTRDASLPPPEGSGLPGTVLNELHYFIDKLCDKLKIELIESKIPMIADAYKEQLLINRVPRIVVNKVVQNLEELIMEKLKSTLPSVVTEVLIGKYGPAINNVVKALKDGNLVCSKPCICGQTNNSQLKDSSQDGSQEAEKFPENCINTCPCMRKAQFVERSREPVGGSRGGKSCSFRRRDQSAERSSVIERRREDLLEQKREASGQRRAAEIMERRRRQQEERDAEDRRQQISESRREQFPQDCINTCPCTRNNAACSMPSAASRNRNT
ncbi:uncharacterized protein LOC118434687 [Folsomia candida]|uniref:Uncharacterized protein n=1 Tax=Folsomia candida TaxID=158441 RepID=A0A226ERE2_FOLCA|nr:uncharacterized protein LOC118434687 [Folsomia candida]OXA60203.1 hypothetical protein Fcan01_04353 [Folsomia candida]